MGDARVKISVEINVNIRKLTISRNPEVIAAAEGLLVRIGKPAFEALAKQLQRKRHEAAVAVVLMRIDPDSARPLVKAAVPAILRRLAAREEITLQEMNGTPDNWIVLEVVRN